jgi:demethylmenaquinone methyltransferase/2-methoxy-6-polyprenyl-1,4-benzoquinol methylase
MPEKEMLRVRGDVRAVYGRLSRGYAVVEDWFERGLRRRGLELLDVRQGETVLEVGFGTGCSLVEIGRRVGARGMACGIDITPEMVRRARKRMEKEGLAGVVGLLEGDARHLPCRAGSFDAVYMAGVLELFDTLDIPVVLEEVRRTLRPEGRLGLASMPREGHEGSLPLRLYEWLHRTFPRYASCRPIYVDDAVKDGGFGVVAAEEVWLAGVFPMKLVIARPRADAGGGGRNR